MIVRDEDLIALEDAWASAGFPADALAPVIEEVNRSGRAPRDVGEALLFGLVLPATYTVYNEAAATPKPDEQRIRELEDRRAELHRVYRLLRITGSISDTMPFSLEPKLLVRTIVDGRKRWTPKTLPV